MVTVPRRPCVLGRGGCATGLGGLTIVLKPDRKQVRAPRAAAKKKGKSKKKD